MLKDIPTLVSEVEATHDVKELAQLAPAIISYLDEFAGNVFLTTWAVKIGRQVQPTWQQMQNLSNGYFLGDLEKLKSSVVDNLAEVLKYYEEIAKHRHFVDFLIAQNNQ